MNHLTVWFRGLRGNLLLLIAIPTVLLSISTYFSISGSKELSNTVQVMTHERIPITKLVGDLRSSNHGLMRYLWLGLNSPQKDRADAVKQAQERLSSLRDTTLELSKYKLSQDGMKVFKTIPGQIVEMEKLVSQVEKGLMEGTSESDARVQNLMLSQLAPTSREVVSRLQEIDEAEIKVNATLTAEAEATAKNIFMYLLTGFGIGLVLMFAFGFAIATKLAHSLSRVAESTNQTANQVGAGSEQLSAASQQLSSGATEAAASLEETVSSLEELSSMVKQNAENAKEAANLSQSSRTAAEEGELEIQNLITAMHGISESSKKIEEIINVIDDIAFQTDLLALNAAVEAARAGEQGKGFAVVAEAVRNLAQRSASAAKDINNLIKDSVVRIENGSRIADSSGKALKTIVGSVKKVADLNNEIASASQEQSTGISQISKAMNQLDQVTQGNAASSEEVAASSEEMSAQAMTMTELVGDLLEVINGKGPGGLRSESESRSIAVSRVKSEPARNEKTRSASVIPMRSPTSKKQATMSSPSVKTSAKVSAQDVIPFDDDPPAKVGTTEGF